MRKKLLDPQWQTAEEQQEWHRQESGEIDQATLEQARARPAGLQSGMAINPLSPLHYQGGMECIDAMRQIATPEEFSAHCRLSAFKYIWRAGKKGLASEDLGKAAVYLGWAVESYKEQGR